MRIQETDRVLKDARNSRRAASAANEGGFLSRAWKKITGFFGK